MRLYGASISQILTIKCGHLYLCYPGLVDNLITNDLAHFFTSQGVTEKEANNMYEYTYRRFTTSTKTQSSQSEDIAPVLEQVNEAPREVNNRLPYSLAGD
jgi:hypothetical protein